MSSFELPIYTENEIPTTLNYQWKLIEGNFISHHYILIIHDNSDITWNVSE